MTKADLFLGIDPGRSKTGLALVDGTGAIVALHIAQTECMAEGLEAFAASGKRCASIRGGGTKSKRVGAVVQGVLPVLPVEIGGEAHSTEEARTLYWQVNPPGGWRRLVPLGMLVPSEPLDAYAAVVQVKRWLSLQGTTND